MQIKVSCDFHLTTVGIKLTLLSEMWILIRSLSLKPDCRTKWLKFHRDTSTLLSVSPLHSQPLVARRYGAPSIFLVFFFHMSTEAPDLTTRSWWNFKLRSRPSAQLVLSARHFGGGGGDKKPCQHQQGRVIRSVVYICEKCGLSF